MVYLFYGKDNNALRKKLRGLLDGFKKKDFFGGLFRISPEGFEREQAENIFKGRNIFGKKNVVVCDGLLANKETKDFLLVGLPSAAGSDNIFILVEEVIDKRLLQKIKPYLAKAQAFPLKNGARQEDRQEDKSIFSVVDALSARKPRTAFAVYNRLINKGITPEEIFWKLFWQVKNLLLVSKYKSAGMPRLKIEKNSGLHPFVVKKCLAAVDRFGKEELEDLLEELLLLRHESKIGLRDLSQSLELFLLGI